VELAKRLVESSFADKAFFCNSGTEANEGALKFARKFARVRPRAPAAPAAAARSGRRRSRHLLALLAPLLCGRCDSHWG